MTMAVPPFSLQNTRGDDVSFPGARQSLVCFVKEDCPTCREVMPVLAAMSQALEERVGRRVSRGAVYVTLDRLEAKGIITSHMSAPRAERGGRPRRIISVTPEGMRRLQESREALLTLWDGLEAFGG